MRERNKILLTSIITMGLTSVIVTLFALYLSYRGAFEHRAQELAAVVHDQAELIRELNRETDSPDQILAILTRASRMRHEPYPREVAVGHLRGSDPHIMVLYGPDDVAETTQVFPGTVRGQALQEAALGRSGILIGRDRRGAEALVAYAPVPELGWGVVGKVTLDQMREPYIAAAIEASAVAIVVVLIGTSLLLLVNGSILDRLESSELELRTTVKSLENFKYAVDKHAAVYVTSADGRIIDVNDRFLELSGYALDEIANKAFTTLSADASHEHLVTAVGRQLRDGKIWHGTTRCRRKSGSEYWAETTAVPLPGTAAAIWMQTDVTQKMENEARTRQAKEAADAANEAKSRFLAHMSHEIRTPLSAILGFSQLLENDRLTAQQKSDFVSTIKRNGAHLASLIDDVLDFSKIEAGVLKTERRPLVLAAELSAVEAVFRLKASAKGIDLRIHYDSPVPETIVSDPLRFRQILVNLIGNAVKFTDHGHVDVRITHQRAPRPQLIVDVSDSGPGIEPEIRERLFQPFCQGRSTKDNPRSGSGLGLALSRQLAVLLGGDLRLRESSPGKGSSFELTLDAGPATNANWLIAYPGQPKERIDELPSGTPLSGMKVLIVEDNADNQKLFQTILTAAGATCELASDGAKGIERAHEEDFDVILMDIQMPVMNGLEATRVLRREGVKEPIIALTAYATKEERELCIQEQFSDYYSKPIDPIRLIQNLAHWRESRSPRREPADNSGSPAAAAKPAAPDRRRLSEPAHLASLRSLYADDPVMKPILVSYVNGLEQRLHALDGALARRDWRRLEALSHQQKGAMAGYGFPPLAEEAAHLETIARTVRDPEAASSHLKRLQDLATMARRGIEEQLVRNSS